MYFITSIDPNYAIKGSRDPLGFQVIWQQAGRRLIPYLSTVSSNLIDFQILCLAYAIKERLQINDGAAFESFFIRFEQLMAYTRFYKNDEAGFNGVDKVRKIMNAEPARVKISNNNQEQILSNQRAYGIWGKYIRPFTDMEITKKPSFEKVYQKKLDDNPDFLNQVKAISNKQDGVSYVNIDKLENYFNLIDTPTLQEKELFREALLTDECGNELLTLLPKVTDEDRWNLYNLLDALYSLSENNKFKGALQHIRNTELVLSPLNSIFRYLQTHSVWKNEEIENDEFISSWRNAPQVDGLPDTTKKLASLFQKSNLELVAGLIERNKEVSKLRRSSPWMQLTTTGLEVNHFDGKYLWDEFRPDRHNDNWYFLNTFRSLYDQLN